MGYFPWEFDLLLQAGKDRGPACCHLFWDAAWSATGLFLVMMFPSPSKHGIGTAQL